MSVPTEALDALADLLVYPREDLDDRAGRAHLAAREISPAAEDALGRFLREAERLSPTEREELFTRTFDLNPVCCLEVGWHLWGDRYERGDFLARIRGLLREHGVEENGELPDHLSHVLPLLGRLDPGVGGELAEKVVRPALGKMRAALKDGDNPWRHVLVAAAEALAAAPAPAGEEAR